MKKVLFATTALIATAGMASADINLSGGGRIGLVYSSATGTADSIRFEKRMTINIDGSGETDGGLSFGGRIRLRSDENDTGATTGNAANIYLGNDTWRVTVGNTDGAMLNRISYFQGSVGLTGLGYRNVSFNMGTSNWGLNSYSSNGNAGAVIRLDFNVGDFGVSLSSDTRGSFAAAGAAHEDAIAVSYNFGDWKVGAGFASEGAGDDIWSLAASGNIGDFGVGVQYSDRKGVASKITLNGSYDFGDTTVAAFVAKTSEDTVGSAGIGAANSETEYGIGFTHSLGGATLAGGIVRDYTEETSVDIGVRFSF